MSKKAPVEDLLRRAFDRLTRQEQRMEAIEASMRRRQPAVTPVPPAKPTVLLSPGQTPAATPWPRRDEPAKPPADRVKELEARLLEAEERVRIANRLETVGRLVAGVAHDFNNLLTIIAGNAEVIHTTLPASDPLCESAEHIAEAAQTAANVTRQLVVYSRHGHGEPCPVDANAAVRSVERILRRLIGERVTLELACAPSVPIVRAETGQFDQVLLNLIVNARDAITTEGTVTIRTAAATVAADRAGWPTDVPPGEFVAVTVTDTGVGMTQDVRARIFDPFFTTKEGRGTGLGLATVRDIVRSAAGHIEVDSSPGWGTSVRVFWPVFPSEPTPPPTALRLAP